jgi:hypothetical protein
MRGDSKPAVLHELAGKKQPDCATEQHSKQWPVSQQEQPEVHRRRTRDEVDEDVGVCVGLHPDWQLVGEVADCLLLAFAEEQMWVVPNLQTIAEMPEA